MSSTFAALVMASVASNCATRPLVSIIPIACPFMVFLVWFWFEIPPREKREMARKDVGLGLSDCEWVAGCSGLEEFDFLRPFEVAGVGLVSVNVDFKLEARIHAHDEVVETCVASWRG